MTEDARPLGSNYRLLERIGQGAMGEVWRGVDRDDHPVAVKLLLPHLAKDPVMVQRFVAERGLLTGVRHRNVVEIKDMVVEGASLAIVMEYVPGADLRSLLQSSGPLTPALVAHVGQSVAQGLDAIHQRGVFHRDVKPENVLLAGGEGLAMVPKLTDFGISRLVSSDGAATATMVVGTPYYMAPELADGSLPTAKSDLYALGVMLYELCCGLTPFQGRSPLAVMQAHATVVPGRPGGIPDQLWAVVSRLLAKDPALRPATDAEVVGSLAPLVQELDGIPAAPLLTEAPAGSPVANTGTAVFVPGAAGATPTTAPAPHTDTMVAPAGWTAGGPGAVGVGQVPGQSFGGQSFGGQSFGGQPQPGQSYPGYAQSGYPHSGYPQPGQSYPGQPGMTGGQVPMQTMNMAAQSGFQPGLGQAGFGQAGYGQVQGPGTSGVGWGAVGATPASPPPPRKKGALVALALVPLVALVAGGTWFLTSGSNEETAASLAGTQSSASADPASQPASTPAATVVQTAQAAPAATVVQTAPAATQTVQVAAPPPVGHEAATNQTWYRSSGGLYRSRNKACVDLEESWQIAVAKGQRAASVEAHDRAVSLGCDPAVWTPNGRSGNRVYETHYDGEPCSKSSGGTIAVFGDTYAVCTQQVEGVWAWEVAEG